MFPHIISNCQLSILNSQLRISAIICDNTGELPKLIMNKFQRLTVASTLFISGIQSAIANNNIGSSNLGTPGLGGNTNIREVITDLILGILSFMALVATIVIIIAGIRVVVSQGEQDQIDKAKKTVMYAIIGLILIILATGIVTVIRRGLGA